MQQRRKKLSSGDAAAAAIIPDPSLAPAPPHEERGADPWDAAVEVPLEDLKARRVPSVPVSNGKGWGYVVETIVSIDPELEYQRLYEALTLGDNATEYGAVLDACNRAEQNCVDATRLVRHAKLEEGIVDRKVGEKLEVLRTTARTELMKEVEDSRDAKGKSSMRAPTLGDVEDRMMANWPDEYAQHKRRKEEIHAALRTVESLETAWRSRCATLRAIMERVAPSRPR